ncbi:hypothetical protein SBOR_1675 [Sclerotinia borealis F-4128]|uniref:Trimethylguanosine synthase n=1 Tax=Sclerotinia borealis (strain F-4128) TaxID=1432307 RepID=W9CMD6_SCLBF|nr:hypothetical protein SBOR_1675 [Sclerotinia borealis F-4128]
MYVDSGILEVLIQQGCTQRLGGKVEKEEAQLRMRDRGTSFLEEEIQDLITSAGSDRLSLESSGSTFSPSVRRRQQKEKNRQSSKNQSPTPALLAISPPKASVVTSNSERLSQVIIRQASAVVSSSNAAVPSEVDCREEAISSPSFTKPTATNSSSRLIRSGSVFQEVKHVSRPRTRPGYVPKSRGLNSKRLDTGLDSSKRSIARERPTESHRSDTVKSPISKLRSRQGEILTSVSAQFGVSSRQQANLTIVKALLESARALSTRSIKAKVSSEKPSKMTINGGNYGHDVTVDHEENQEDPVQFDLDDKCTHYTNLKEVPWDLHKYWQQRYSMFSLYDYGIYMTDDAWFGVTPEPVATQIAQDYASSTPPTKTTIIDIFAGAGGNSIAFALSNRWAHVIAIEKDPSVIACAENNAYVYGITNQITWVNGDCFEYLKTHASSINPSETVIFASPPWGGPGYTTENIFDLSTMQPYSAQYIHEACKTMDTALYLPRTSDLKQITRLLPEGKKVELVQYCMEGASKALVAYIPAIE